MIRKKGSIWFALLSEFKLLVWERSRTQPFTLQVGPIYYNYTRLMYPDNSASDGSIYDRNRGYDRLFTAV